MSEKINEENFLKAIRVYADKIEESVTEIVRLCANEKQEKIVALEIISKIERLQRACGEIKNSTFKKV